MLITVSGMVGSGKSTISRALVQHLADVGTDCTCVRFRRSAWWRPGNNARSPRRAGQAPKGGIRWKDFRPRRLSAWLTFGYIFRILAFRLFGPRPAEGSIVLDRYFYDSFAHYTLRTGAERFYMSVLRRLIPAPDLALLLVTSTANLRARRPEYSVEYIELAARGYDALQRFFPALVTICTDSEEVSLAHLERVLRAELRQVDFNGISVNKGVL
jgi:thymidylate kinase